MHSIISNALAFKNNYLFWIDFPSMTVKDIIEIAIIAFLFYHVIVWMKNTRAWALLKGLLVVLIFILFAAMFQMSTILWLAGKVLNFAVIALLVIFAPELRRALETLGRKRFITSIFNSDFFKTNDERFTEKTMNDLVRACFDMGKVKTGALIVVEQNNKLTEYERTGITLDSVISYQLLVNIFEHNTPLHDGAIIVRENRIIAATCYLPLSENMQLSKELGTRHRAAVGISEVSDSLTIVVSEETGQVSIAHHGKIERDIDPEYLRSELKNINTNTTENLRTGLFQKQRRSEE
ncbi:diadenylate cyclase CdaA [Eubacterium oxidoreducens]|uniref:Diadenylate cyclase n=1 Tax=Eubacterium oxidoreducens TaxID=1732 RepID=A0A1G6ACY3_EUBOX|nr:diadenylate cyclase CdaA [Eubacterium oxidoreducens]SDB06288.1 diadenylate cyclase [Eubacterium oxidoreducens]